MATIEERVQALEQEIVARKKAEELLTIAVRALVSKEAFEKLQDTVEKLQDTVESKEAFEKLQGTVEASQEQNGKLFDALNTHNIITNERLGDIQDQLIALDGKTVGLQTEMRQRFAEQDGKITALDGKTVGLQTEMRQRFAEQDGKITALDGKITALDGKITGVQATQTEQTALLQQVLARLPEQP